MSGVGCALAGQALQHPGAGAGARRGERNLSRQINTLVAADYIGRGCPVKMTVCNLVSKFYKLCWQTSFSKCGLGRPNKIHHPYDLPQPLYYRPSSAMSSKWHIFKTLVPLISAMWTGHRNIPKTTRVRMPPKREQSLQINVKYFEILITHFTAKPMDGKLSVQSNSIQYH